MDPIYFLPESKHCYDLISDDLASKDETETSISFDSIDSSTDPVVVGDYFLSCCETGNLVVIKKLLEFNNDLLNFKDTDGYTGLHRACYNGHLDAIEFLINAGANIAEKTEDEWQPLHCACRWNQVDAAYLLIKYGVDINCQTAGGQTPLHLASASPDHAKTLELLLLDKRINPSLKNGASETAYDIAHRTGPHYKLFEIVDPSI